MTETNDMILDIEQTIEIKAAPGDVYRGLIKQMTDMHGGPNGESLPMCLEEWPGGRWFRDLGQSTGHLWGFVQSIKPPNLLEICGPLFMSYAVSNNLLIRVETVAGGSLVKLRHLRPDCA